MNAFDEVYERWLSNQIANEKNPRRRERLEKGLSYGTVLYLRSIWFPAIGNLDHLYPEYEVRDLNNGCRYLDLAYMPSDSKGCIEIQDYRTHARDIEIARFKDLCLKQALLSLDGWLFLPIAFLSIRDDPSICKQLTLAFVGKFLSVGIRSELNWAEAETLRFARSLVRPFTPRELSSHLRLTERRTREHLHQLVNKQLIVVASGNQRYRTFKLSRSDYI